MHQFCLRVTPGRQEDSVKLNELVFEARVLSDNQLLCRSDPNSVCHGGAIDAQLVPATGNIMFINIVRATGDAREKIVTEISDPDDEDDDQWPGMALDSVMCHRQETDDQGVTRGHWVCYRKAESKWFKIDSLMTPGIFEENPFIAQSEFQTIDLLLFKSLHDS